MTKFVRFHGPVIIFMAGIFILSSIPDLTPPYLGFKTQDKVYHFLFYAVFGYFIARSFFYQDSFPTLRKNFILLSVLFGTLYGLTDEIHQYYVPGRIMSYGDFLADMLGVTAGAAMFFFRYKVFSLFIKNKFKKVN